MDAREQREPEQFFDTGAGADVDADAVYFVCVRTIFERTWNSTLPELDETSDAVGKLIGRPATTLRGFAERHRDQLVREPDAVPAAYRRPPGRSTAARRPRRGRTVCPTRSSGAGRAGRNSTDVGTRRYARPAGR